MAQVKAVIALHRVDRIVVQPVDKEVAKAAAAVAVKEALSQARAAVKVEKAEVDAKTLRQAAYLLERMQLLVALRKAEHHDASGKRAKVQRVTARQLLCGKRKNKANVT